MNRLLPVSAFVAGLLLSSAPAWSQGGRKPDAPPQEYEDPYPIDYDAFADAYFTKNEPVVLVLCGWAVTEHDTESPGAGLFNQDTSGITFQLKSSFEEWINHPSVDLVLVDVNAQHAAIRRLTNVLELSRESDAINLLANELRADVVLIVRLLDRNRDGGPNRVEFRALDMARGTTISTFPLQWKLSTSTIDIKRQAKAMASKFCSDYVARAQYTQRYTVRALGLTSDPRQLQQVRRAFEAIPGVQGVRPRGTSSMTDPVTGRADTLTNFEVRYDADGLALASELAVAIDEERGFTSEVRDMVATTITLRVRIVEEPSGEEAAVERPCRQVILLRNEAGEKEREELRELYRQKDSPSIAVLVNRSPTKDEREAEGVARNPSVSGETVIVVQAAGRDVGGGAAGGNANQPPRGDDTEARQLTFFEVQTNLMEEALYNRLGENLLGFTRIHPSSARNQLEAAIDKQRKIYREHELVEIMHQKEVADIIIFGAGTIVPDLDGTYSAVYTFSAVNVSDSQILGTASVRGRLDANMHEVVNGMADEAISSLACEMMQFWRPPSKLQVTINNAESDQDYLDITSVIADRARTGEPVRIIGRPSFEGGAGQGVIRLALDYNCPFDELIRQFREISAQLSFDLETERINPNDAVFTIVR